MTREDNLAHENPLGPEKKPGKYWLALPPAAIFLFILPINHTVTLRLAVLFIALLIALQSFYKEKNRPDLPLKIPILMWGGLALASLMWSVDATYSFREIKDEIGYGLITYFVFFTLTKNRAAFLFFIVALTMGFLFLSGTVALAHVRIGAWRAEEFPGNVGTFSTYLVTVLPFFILAILYNLKRRWLAYLSIFLLVFLLLYTGYLTLNRAVWPAAILTGIIFGALFFIKAERPRAKKSAVLVLLAFCGLAIFQFIAVSMEKSMTSYQSASVTLSISKDLRIPLWRYTAEKVADNPMLGLGFGKRILEKDLKTQFANNNLWHAHNLFLNYALQLGLIGVGVLVFLFLALYREFWRLYRARDERVYLLGICGIALITGVLAKNMTDDFFVRDNALLFWALVGMILGYGERCINRVRKETNGPADKAGFLKGRRSKWFDQSSLTLRFLGTMTPYKSAHGSVDR